MSFEACAALVEKGDPLRFRVAMAAPVAARRVLFPLYAFNIEVARAPWVTEEPMIAEMRLQWWRDALEEIAEGAQPRKHEVVDALAELLDTDAARCLDGLIAARRWDVYKDAFEDQGHLESYIDATSGHLMWTAARLLGQVDEQPVRDFAFAVGVANLFQAAPVLESRQRKPLLDGTESGIAKLAQQALDRHRSARNARRRVTASAPLIAGYHALPILRAVATTPALVATGLPDPNPAKDALRFAKVNLLGWWR